jgi:hypothetical protein
MAETGLNGSEIAARAGVAASTINRPINTPGYSGNISRTTIERVAAATGVDYRPFMPQAAMGPPPATFPAPVKARRVPADLAAQVDGIRIKIEGHTAFIEALVTTENIAELRRKLDLIESIIKL